MGSEFIRDTQNAQGAARSAQNSSWGHYQQNVQAQRDAEQRRADRTAQQTSLRSQYTNQLQQSRAAQPPSAAPVFTPGKQVFK